MVMNPYDDVKNRTIGFALEDKAKKNKDRIFLYFEDQKISYDEMNRNANKIANGFSELGVGKGENVCILMPNCPEYFYLWFGLSKIGAVEVPINVHYKGDMLEYILNNSEAKILVVDQMFLDNVEGVKNNLNHIKQIVLFSRTDYGDAELQDARPRLPWFRVTSYQNLFDHPDDAPSVKVKYSDPFAIMYTSGTTGPSKGVILPHNYALAAFPEPMQKYLGVTSNDVFHNCWPMFHVTAQIEVAMVAFMADGQCALVDRFSASKFWDEVRQYKCTRFSYMGPVIAILMKQEEKPDDLDNPMEVGFGVPTPKAIHQAFEDRFGVKLCEPYGSTDIGFATLNHLLDYKVGIGTCGKPIDTFDVTIFDDDDNELHPGEVGEIVVRPKKPYIMLLGYYNMPDVTIEAFRNFWFHTGDFGYRDKDGYFYFVGRKKDAIRRRGENISSQEVEEIIDQCPDVAKSAVIGVPSKLGEEDVMAVIKLKLNTTTTPEEILDFCQDRMAYFMLPRYIEVIDEFPLTPTNKIEKYKLKDKGITENTWDREKAGYKVKK